MSTLKVRTLSGKARNPVTWDGDVLEDPDEAEATELPDSDYRFILPEEVAILLLQRMNPTLAPSSNGAFALAWGNSPFIVMGPATRYTL